MKISEIKNNTSFKGADVLYNAANLFIKSQENLSSTRFIQDTTTNWVPKAVFSRSKEDLAEMSFLEFLESAIFYFASPILGEKLFRNKVFKNFIPRDIKKEVNSQIPKTVEEITKNANLSDAVKKSAISTKAGIVLACAMIPIAEYTLSFAKNLFTLKAFKKSNFNNIANLDKGKQIEKENIAQQQKVEKHSKRQLKKALLLSTAGVIGGIALAKSGNQKISKAILEPGKALAKNIKNEKIKNALSKISFDFANNEGKLALSKGQLGLTAILGLFGYSKAAEDRGKLDVAEVWTRVPLVVFYTIFGSELFEKGFTKILKDKKIFPDIVNNSPTLKELPELARKVAKENGTNASSELKRLTKQKAVVSGIPYAFSLLFMGFTLSAITRFWTQFRYNHQNKNQNTQNNDSFVSFKNKIPEIYKDFNQK